MSPIRWKTTVPARPFDSARVWKVAASAGCGKTFTVERCIKELLDAGTRPDEIMYVTFNRLPASGFRARFPQFEPSATRWWNTHHSVCLRLLREAGRPCGVMSSSDWADFGQRHGYDFAGLPEDDAEAVDGKESAALRDRVATRRADGSPMDDDELQFHAQLLSYERETGKLSFPSMMDEAMSADLFPPSVRYVFVDEAQDNGSVQNAYWLRILDKFPNVAGFMLVGDDKQAINRFKGGNAEEFLSFPADVCVSFDTSYRCPAPVLRFANEIAAPIRERSPLVGISAARSPGSVTDCQKFSYVVEDLRSDLSDGKSVLVLCRTNLYAGFARNALSAARIPYHSEEMERIRRVFRAFRDIRETGRLSSASMSVLRPFSDSLSPHVAGDLRLKCDYYDHALRQKVLSDRREAGSARARIADSADDDADIPVEEALRRGFTDRFVMDVFWARSPDPSFFVGSDMGRKVSLVSDWIRDYGIDYPVARAMTVHASKGSEADVVVLVGDVPDFFVDVERDEEADERRVWYVAATRSREKLIITRLSEKTEFTRFL